jgi:hypothetical protein
MVQEKWHSYTIYLRICTLDQNLQVVQSWNILANATSGDYYEIAYAANATVFSFPTIAGNVTVGYPASPSIIVTVTPVGA